ncbi:glycosyltransferase [bacterium]|nr:glycosyltransferase [bacterium]
MEFSLIIPAHNRKRLLMACLDSVREQTFNKDRMEVIVIDDGSKGSAIKKVVDGFKNLLSHVVYYRGYPSKGPAYARNIGVSLSTSSIVGFTDDDCVLEPDWIEKMVETHQRNQDIVAVGGLTIASSQGIPVLVGQFLSTCSIENVIYGKKEIIFFPTCNVSLKRWIFEKHRLNEIFLLPAGEDLEFFWRLFQAGHRFVWNKDIKVIHYRKDAAATFIKQAYMYGRGNLLVRHLYNDHPLLKELKTSIVSFWGATFMNMIKIGRFSYILGKRFIKESNTKVLNKKLEIYLFFVVHKIFYILGNIVEFFKIRKKVPADNLISTPRLLILDVTHNCNLDCRICDIWKTGVKEKNIDILYVKKMLKQAKKLGIKEIALSGGEPLLRKDIFEIFDYARKTEIKQLGVLTNGILIKEYFERLKPYLIDNTISLVNSLDSLKPNVHNYIRNSDIAWQRSIESLKLLSSLKKEYPQINFNVIAIILNQNLEELPDLADFVRKLNANSLQFQTLLSNNLKMSERKKSSFWISEDRLIVLDKLIDKLIELKKENPQFIIPSIRNLSLTKKYFRGTLKPNDVKCLSAYETVLISNQGKAVTCFSSYGDIKRQDLKEILQGKEIIKAWGKVKKCAWPCLLPCFCGA